MSGRAGSTAAATAASTPTGGHSSYRPALEYGNDHTGKIAQARAFADWREVFPNATCVVSAPISTARSQIGTVPYTVLVHAPCPLMLALTRACP